eukprot:755718-Hanusia_phi.AAC.3
MPLCLRDVLADSSPSTSQALPLNPATPFTRQHRAMNGQEKDRVEFFTTVGRGMQTFAVDEIKRKLGKFQVRMVLKLLAL